MSYYGPVAPILNLPWVNIAVATAAKQFSTSHVLQCLGKSGEIGYAGRRFPVFGYHVKVFAPGQVAKRPLAF
jgi:hypothetical protein